MLPCVRKKLPVAGSVSGIDKGTKAPRILSDAWENGCQRGRMDMSKYSREDIIRMVEDEDWCAKWKIKEVPEWKARMMNTFLAGH